MTHIDLKSVQRILCIFRPFRIYGREASAHAHLTGMKKLRAYPAHLATYRINPRTCAYMLDCAQAFRQTEMPGTRMDLFIPPSQTGHLTDDRKAAFDNIWCDSAIDAGLESALRAGNYDLVILLYPDPVGIGWSHIERTVKKLALPIAILNGRKRFFYLDPKMHRAVKLRRLLERFWGAEALFTILFFLSLPLVLAGDLLSRFFRLFRSPWKIPRPRTTTRSPQAETKQVQNWWTKSPMVYGQTHGQPVYKTETGGETRLALGGEAFFKQVDDSLYRWNQPLHTNSGKFAKIFPYDAYRDKRVLEIGCGMGTMAMNWAQQGAHITPADLTATAVRQTARRFKSHALPGTPCQAQAEHLPFPDASFDYIYSWGVLHHTPNTSETICELHRALKPGGRTGVMLYNRKSILYWFWVRFYEGWLHLERRFLDELALASRYGDGAREEGNPHTWPVTEAEITADLFAPFCRVRVRKLGTELDNIFKRAMPGLGHVLPRFIKKAYARRWGWSLWIEAEKE